MSDVVFLQTSYSTNQPKISYPSANEDGSILVYVDIETTGLRKDDEIVQIAAKCAKSNEKNFSSYAYPLKNIPNNVSEKTGLKMTGGQLFLKNKPVLTKSLKEVVVEFLNYLQNLKKPVILVGLNALKFDFPRIYRKLRDFNLLQDFCNVVYGLVDTYQILIADKNLSKEEASLKQDDLAKKYIPHWDQENAHEALWDCITLEKICDAMQLSEKLPHFAVKTKAFNQKQFKNW